MKSKVSLNKRYNDCFHNSLTKKVMIFLHKFAENPRACKKYHKKWLIFRDFETYRSPISHMASYSIKYYVPLRAEATRPKIFEVKSLIVWARSEDKQTFQHMLIWPQIYFTSWPQASMRHNIWLWGHSTHWRPKSLKILWNI